MMITRGVRPERDFAIIGNALLRDKSLSFRARGILCCVLSHVEGYQLSSDRLVDMGTEGRDAIRNALTELESAGYLKRTKSQDAQGRWSSSAVISDVPDLLVRKAPRPEKPTPENPASVNQSSVYQALKEDQEEDKKKKELQKPVLPKISFDGIKFQDLTDEQVSIWTGAYPAVKVPAEILKAAAWIDANPANKKSDYKRFLNGWLSRAQDKAPRVQDGTAPARQYAAPQAESFAERDARNKREKWERETGKQWPVDELPTGARPARPLAIVIDENNTRRIS